MDAFSALSWYSMVRKTSDEVLALQRQFNAHLNQAAVLSPSLLFAKVASATVGASTTSLLMTPFDVVKTRLQAQSPKELMCAGNSTADCSRCKYFIKFNGLMEHTMPKNFSTKCMQYPVYTSTHDAFSRIVRTEGISALYRGLTPTLLLAVPNTITYFVLYDELTKRMTALLRASQIYLQKQTQQQTTRTEHRIHDTNNINSKVVEDLTKFQSIVPAFAGITARLVAATIISPLELIRTRMQAQRSSSPSFSIKRSQIMYHVKDIVQDGGVKALWRGLTPTLWRDVPFSGIYWFSYEYMKKELKQRHVQCQCESQYQCKCPSNSPTRQKLDKTLGEVELDSQTVLMHSLIAGSTSGSIAAILTNPFDVLKTRQQVRALPFGDGTRNGKTKLSLRKTFELVLKESGPTGFYAGLAPRLAKVAPACAIMISSYEVGKKVLAI